MPSLKHVETQTASGDSSIDFTSVFDSSEADRYVVYVDNVVASSDADSSAIRFSTDGGSNWDSGSSDYAMARHYVHEGGATSTNGDSGDSQIDEVLHQVGNSPSNNDLGSGVGVIFDPTDANRSTVTRFSSCRYINSISNDFASVVASGQRLAQSAVDSFQFFFTSGNISSGRFSVYALTEGSGGAMDHIETQTASGDSSLDFTSVFGSSDGYDRYVIQYNNIVPANDNVHLQARYSADGGSNWDSGSSDYAWSRFFVSEQSNSGGSGSSGTTEINRILNGLGNSPGSNDTTSGHSVIWDPTDSNRATAIRNTDAGHRATRGGSLIANYSGGIRLAQSAVDSIQFFMSSGNISSGKISVFGVGS